MYEQQTYRFKDQHRLGKQAEQVLDAFFSRWYWIKPTTPEMQREGVDRLFIPKRQVCEFPKLVEYKTDFKDTGRAFIELNSVIRQNQTVKGWVHTTTADFIVYFAVHYQTAFVFSVAKLREILPQWERTYPVAYCQNTYGKHPYKSLGLLVPLTELMFVAKALFKI